MLLFSPNYPLKFLSTIFYPKHCKTLKLKPDSFSIIFDLLEQLGFHVQRAALQIFLTTSLRLMAPNIFDNFIGSLRQSLNPSSLWYSDSNLTFNGNYAFHLIVQLWFLSTYIGKKVIYAETQIYFFMNEHS